MILFVKTIDSMDSCPTWHAMICKYYVVVISFLFAYWQETPHTLAALHICLSGIVTNTKHGELTQNL